MTTAENDSIALGSTGAVNSIEVPNAVKVEKKEITPANNVVTVTIASLSAGLLNLK